MTAGVISVVLWDAACTRCSWSGPGNPYARVEDAEAAAWAHDMAGCLVGGDVVRLEGFEPPAP